MTQHNLHNYIIVLFFLGCSAWAASSSVAIQKKETAKKSDISQCPAFSPPLSPGNLKNFRFSVSGTSFADHLEDHPFALECSIAGRESLVTPLFAHRATSNDISPLRKVTEYGMTNVIKEAAFESEFEEYLKGELPSDEYASPASGFLGRVRSFLLPIRNSLSYATTTFATGMSQLSKAAEPEYHFVVDDNEADTTDTIQKRFQRVSNVLIDKKMWRRVFNTFGTHFMRIFGRVVTRVEYTIASNENKQFVPTLKMFVVRAKRVITDSPNKVETEKAPTENEEVFAKTQMDTDVVVPLSCEAWEASLNDKLLSEAEAPHRDLFPDAAVRRQQKMAKYLQALERGAVEEVCKPFSSSWLPPWLQAQFAWSGTKSSTRLVYSSVLDKCSSSDHSAVDGHVSQECKDALDHKTSEFRCDVSVPIDSHSCLVLESIYRDRHVGISMSQVYVWDTAIIGFVLFFLAVGLLRPILVSNRYLQIGAASALGIFFVLLVIVIFIIRDLRKTRIGQLGVIAMVAAIGVASFSETVTSMLWYYLTVEIRTNPYIQVGMVVSAIAAAFISRYFFYDKVPTITNYSLKMLQVATWVALCAHNREASVLVALVLLFGKMRFAVVVLFRIAFLLGYSVLYVLCLPIRMVRWMFGLGSKSDSEPRDSFPAEASLPQAYVRPTVAEGIFGATTEAKMKKFEAQGSDFTRKALKDLAAQIRANPSALSRVHDPNGLARFAGISGRGESTDVE